MTEAQAWRKVAQKVEAARPLQGLCREMHEMRSDRRISHLLWLQMVARLAVYCSCGSFVYPPGTEREARVLAALWLALEAEEEDA